MTFRAIRRSDWGAGHSPLQLVDQYGHQIEWANRFLDAQCVRGLQPVSLQSYAYTLLHFLPWWSGLPGVDVSRFTAEQFTESTRID